MKRIFAWVLAMLKEITKGRVTSVMENDFVASAYCADKFGPMMRQKPEQKADPHPLKMHIPAVAATRPRVAVWVGLVCDEWTMTFEPEGGGPKVEIVDPVEQWRYVYRGTAFENLN